MGVLLQLHLAPLGISAMTAPPAATGTETSNQEVVTQDTVIGGTPINDPEH